MSNVSKEIYRKITTLIPDLHQIEPFHKVELKDRGYPGIEFTIIESNPNKINFIISRYENENGQLIANPSIEIVAKPGKKVANVKTYKDIDYFHSAVPVPTEIGTIALHRANRFLFDFLNDLRSWRRPLLIEKNTMSKPRIMNGGK